jgi:hypothetical protein
MPYKSRYTHPGEQDTIFASDSQCRGYAPAGLKSRATLGRFHRRLDYLLLPSLDRTSGTVMREPAAPGAGPLPLELRTHLGRPADA